MGWEGREGGRAVKGREGKGSEVGRKENNRC